MPERNIIALLLGLLSVGMTHSAVADDALHDPTRPYHVTATQSRGVPRFKVNAIFVSDERRIAIVNGQRVAVGGQVSGATVVAINKNDLTLNLDGRQFTASLSRGASRR